MACETFCLDNEDTLVEIAQMLHDVQISASTIRFVEAKAEDTLSGIKRVIIFLLQHFFFFFQF